MGDTIPITVVGAGVIGLTCALVLSRDPRNKVTVVCEFMPGDYDIGYASCWAGANFFPMGEPGSLQAQLEARTWSRLKHLATNVPEACIHFQDATLYTREEDADGHDPLFRGPGETTWWHDLVDNYHHLADESLPSGIAAATRFTTVCINTALYLPYLMGQCNRQGVVFQRQKLQHIQEAADLVHEDGRRAQIIVNATGLGALHLKGVEDKAMYPARGQIMLVQNEPGVMMAVSGGKDGNGLGYCMSRAVGGGTVMGGCYQKHSFEAATDLDLARRFMKTCIEFCPTLVGPGEGVEALQPVRHGVGLRPVREGGVRIDKELMNNAERTAIIHCYGHGGWGYQTSWASAEMVMQLVQTTARAELARL